MRGESDCGRIYMWLTGDRFGLGRVYQKMGKTRFAEYHFRRALEINPSNVVLYCCVGTVSSGEPRETTLTPRRLWKRGATWPKLSSCMSRRWKSRRATRWRGLEK